MKPTELCRFRTWDRVFVRLDDSRVRKYFLMYYGLPSRTAYQIIQKGHHFMIQKNGKHILVQVSELKVLVYVLFQNFSYGSQSDQHRQILPLYPEKS